jgi:hypothetical protein
MIDEWLKSNRNYTLAWLLTLVALAFAAYVNVELRQPAVKSPVEDSVLRLQKEKSPQQQHLQPARRDRESPSPATGLKEVANTEVAPTPWFG